MSRSTVVRLPRRDDSHDPAYRDPAYRDPAYTVRLTDSGIARDLLCLEYLVFPVPPELAGDRDLHDGAAAGLAVAGHDVHRRCVSGYRTAADGHCVVGAVRIGPAAWPVLGRVTVVFAPFAHTASLRHDLCEVRLVVEAGRVRSARIRTM